MLEIMEVYKKEIENYCVKSNLSVDKVFSADICYNEEYVLLQEPYVPKEGWENSVIDGPPTPVPNTLEIYLENGKLRFVQTPLTYKHLSADHIPQTPYASTGKLAFA
jgi:hypothetical protein